MAETAIKGSGLVLIAGALLLGVGIVTVSLGAPNARFSTLVSVLLLVASILVMLALPGMYARQAGAAGALGLAGHVLLETGLLLVVVLAADPLIHPALREPPGENIVLFLLGIALLLGLLLTGIATLIAGVFPRGSAVLLLAATAGFLFVFFIAEFLPPRTGQVGVAVLGLLLGSALAWIGVSISR